MWLFVVLLSSMCATLGFMLSASDRDRNRLLRQIRELEDLVQYKNRIISDKDCIISDLSKKADTFDLL
jgi:hypothetical protein